MEEDEGESNKMTSYRGSKEWRKENARPNQSTSLTSRVGAAACYNEHQGVQNREELISVSYRKAILPLIGHATVETGFQGKERLRQDQEKRLCPKWGGILVR
jgi:hypothetical protein